MRVLFNDSQLVEYIDSLECENTKLKVESLESENAKLKVEIRVLNKIIKDFIEE